MQPFSPRPVLGYQLRCCLPAIDSTCCRAGRRGEKSLAREDLLIHLWVWLAQCFWCLLLRPSSTTHTSTPLTCHRQARLSQTRVFLMLFILPNGALSQQREHFWMASVDEISFPGGHLNRGGAFVCIPCARSRPALCYLPLQRPCHK